MRPLTFKLGLYYRHLIIILWCPFKRRSLGESDIPQRPKLNTYYRRMQLAFKQYVELRDCNKLKYIPNLNQEVFDQMDDWLGEPEDTNRILDYSYLDNNIESS